jgi:hypothetical protein
MPPGHSRRGRSASVLYRLFPRLLGAGPHDPGGALYVPRFDQGAGRHDFPDLYGVLYLSRQAVSPLAEHLRILRTRTVTERHLSSEGRLLSLATVDDGGVGDILDLDDPRSLVQRSLRPSAVATRNRELTQSMAVAIYEEGVPGFQWWSTIEASWINVTLFEDRVMDQLTLTGDPEPLTLEHPAVREAAEAVGVLLAT